MQTFSSLSQKVQSRNAKAILKTRCISRGLANVRDIVSSSPSRIAILYGTHSGNTQRSAQLFQSELKSRFNVSASLANLADINFKGTEQLTRDEILVLLVSTYGDGEPNAATKEFWDYVHQSSELQRNFQFAYSVLSRGNSLYDSTFAQAGISLDAQLHRLGAKRLSPVGIQDKISSRADDQFFQWKEKLLIEIRNIKNLTERAFSYSPSIEVKEVEPTELPKELELQKIHYRLDPQAKARKIKVKELQSTDRVYVHADLHVPGYQTGDYVVIWPQNSESKVQAFLSTMFGRSNRRDSLLQFGDGKFTSYETLARHYIDVSGQADHELLSKLSHMAPSQEASLRCTKLLMNTSRELPGLVELLSELSPEIPWIKSLPPSAFFDVLPPLQPRRYSVSSSSSESPDWAGFTCVVEEDKATGFEGVATTELLRMTDRQETEVMAVNEPLPSFRMPLNKSVPLLLFGVGTGVAPFRGFVRERKFQAQTSTVGPIALFTGTRTREDLVHYEELEEVAFDQPFDFDLIPARSRVDKSDPNHGYLVEMLEKHADLIYDYIQKGAHIYICGDVRKVRNTVRRRLMEIVLQKMDKPLTETKPLWKRLTKEGRTHLELW